MLSFVVVNFAFAFHSVLLIPLLLRISTEQTAGVVVSLGALGIAAGSLTLSIWGGPTDRIRGVYLPIIAMGAGMVIMGLRPSVAWVIVGLLLMNGTHPIAGGSSQSIWQSKVPPGLQGRVFAIRQVSAIASAPLAFLAAGTLADRLLEPMMASDRGLLTDVIGSGPGRGIGLLFVLTGTFAVLTAVAVWSHPQIRNLEASIPDLEASPTVA
jgi:MFS family permease